MIKQRSLMIAVVVGVAAFLLGTGSTAMQPTMIDLDTLGGDFSQAFCINNRGQVVGESTTGSGTHAFLWEKGTMIDLGAIDGVFSRAEDINDHGQVVGQSTTGSGTHALLWDPKPKK